MKQLFLTFCFLLPLLLVRANDFPFQAGEELMFDIHYKYGLVMLKAGSANYKVVESNYKNKSSFQSTLDFRTSSFFDKVFKMRDTLRSITTKELYPLYHIRVIHEGNYHFSEEMFFNDFNPRRTEVRIRKESDQMLKYDTVLTSNMMSYDLLNLVLVICAQDYSQPESIKSNTISVFIGKDRLNVTVRYEGQSVVEKSDTLKYKTYKIALDFSDSNFNESKSAIEIWMSDDKNRIPIKIRAKLRIGAAEVYLTSWKNLKYPFTSEIKIPVN